MAEIIVVHGFPGAGKTTQCERVAKEGFDGRKVQHVSAGNLIRGIRNGSIDSPFSDYINSPNVSTPLPDDIVRGAIFAAFERPIGDDELLLVDNYPQFQHAVPDFVDNLQTEGHALLGTVEFEVTFPTSKERILLRGPREGEDYETFIYKLDSFTQHRFDIHRSIAYVALMSLSMIAPVEDISADGEKDAVYAKFVQAIGRLDRRD